MSTHNTTTTTQILIYVLPEPNQSRLCFYLSFVARSFPLLEKLRGLAN
jgi:hypothetical protein